MLSFCAYFFSKLADEHELFLRDKSYFALSDDYPTFLADFGTFYLEIDTSLRI
jgi:hypothetical protein